VAHRLEIREFVMWWDDRGGMNDHQLPNNFQLIANIQNFFHTLIVSMNNTSLNKSGQVKFIQDFI
jgi:hypothetical protein